MSSQPNAAPKPQRRRRARNRQLTQLQRELRNLKKQTKRAKVPQQKYIRIGTSEPVQLPVDPSNPNDVRYHIDATNLRLLVRQIARKLSAGAGDITVHNQQVHLDLQFILHTNEYTYQPVLLPTQGQSSI
ncbi:putative nucleoprotein [Serpentovirinae sp. isolate K48]|uniref:Nucleoprotein n=1 Tax=Serpentovirinae sp. isolate K48 TaxID=3071292 RepID=A0AAE6P0G3_9NIDO|nr:putative nucleoprotein [Serpentovirinae sp.]QFU19758.1 putative nucleoprotein [Serpentovirinae sp.]